MTARWPQLRAGLLALAFGLTAIDACPLPDAKVRARMPAPLSAVLAPLATARNAILRPLRPVRDLVNVHQKFNVFRTADRNRHRMWIEARAADSPTWEVLHIAQDPDHAFMTDELEYRRLRGAWTPRGQSGPRGAYPSFVIWIANQVFASDERFVEARVRMEKVRIGPDGGATTAGVFDFERKRVRGER